MFVCSKEMTNAKKNVPLSVRAGCTQRCHVLQQRLSESTLIICGRQSVPLRGRVVVYLRLAECVCCNITLKMTWSSPCSTKCSYPVAHARTHARTRPEKFYMVIQHYDLFIGVIMTQVQRQGQNMETTQDQKVHMKSDHQ